MKWAPGLRVLVVSDESALVGALHQGFTEMGFTVETAIDAGEAMACLVSHLPDLVCVTLNLPNDSGYSLCELIRGDPSLSNVRILILSDRHLPEDIAYAEEAGANGFLRRPFSLYRLGSYVKALFEDGVPSKPGLRRLRPSEWPRAS